MKKIAILVVYYGKLPSYFDLWFQTVQKNKKIDFIFITDQDLSLYQSSNFNVIKMDLVDLKNKIEYSLHLKDIELKNAYKICDFRFSFGFIFSDLLKGYHYWGYCDLDMIFGNIYPFIKKFIENDCVYLGGNGYFTLLKNAPEVNHLFQKKSIYLFNYKYVYKHPLAFLFDENYGVKRFLNEMNIKVQEVRGVSLKILDYYFFDDKNKFDKSLCFKLEQNPFRLIEIENQEEFAFLHFPKRNLVFDANINQDCYIFPNAIKNSLDKIEDHEEEYKKNQLNQYKKRLEKRRKTKGYWYFVCKDMLYRMVEKKNG